MTLPLQALEDGADLPPLALGQPDHRLRLLAPGLDAHAVPDDPVPIAEPRNLVPRDLGFVVSVRHVGNQLPHSPSTSAIRRIELRVIQAGNRLSDPLRQRCDVRHGSTARLGSDDSIPVKFPNRESGINNKRLVQQPHSPFNASVG